MNRKLVLTSAIVLSMLAVLPLFLGPVSAAPTAYTTPSSPPTILGYSFVAKITLNVVNAACQNLVLGGISATLGLGCGVSAAIDFFTGGIATPVTGTVCVVAGVVFGVQGFVCWLATMAVHYNLGGYYFYVYQRCWYNPFGPQIIAIP